MISQNSVQEVISIAQIEDVVNDFVNLKKRGANLLGLCPFHNEKTPSFTVSPAKNLFKCFGCGKGGDPVTFIMEHENYSFPEAIRFLAQKYGIKLEETVQSEEDKERIQEKESLFIINEFARRFFHESLLDSDEGKSVGLSYFLNRGIQQNTIKEFNLGYSPQNKTALIKRAQEEGYKSEFLEKLGLKSRSGLDFFRARIIFPITNLSGKVVAFGGRTLSKDKKVPKYLNSPESDIYNKSKSLYGIFQAKNEIRRKENCYLVEGYTDVLSLYQNGIKNVVASSGTSLTSGQLKVIKRFTNTITFLYDGDSAGQKAALRGLPLALEEDLNVKIAPLVTEHDPDSLVQEMGASTFTDFLEKENEDFIVYYAKSINNQFAQHPIEKAQAIKDLIEILGHILEPIKRSIYIKEISNILKLQEESLITELNKVIRKKLRSKQKDRNYSQKSSVDEGSFISEKPTKTQDSSPSPILSDYHQEKDLIRILMKAGDQYSEKNQCTIAEFVLNNIHEVIETFENKTFKDILKEAKVNLENENKPYSLDFYLSHSDPAVKELALEFAHSPYEYARWSEQGVELQTQKMPLENYDNDSEGSLYRFLLKKIQDKIDLVENQIKKHNQSPDQLKILLTAKSKLDQSRKEIAALQGSIVL